MHTGYRGTGTGVPGAAGSGHTLHHHCFLLHQKSDEIEGRRPTQLTSPRIAVISERGRYRRIVMRAGPRGGRISI